MKTIRVPEDIYWEIAEISKTRRVSMVEALRLFIQGGEHSHELRCAKCGDPLESIESRGRVYCTVAGGRIFHRGCYVSQPSLDLTGASQSGADSSFEPGPDHPASESLGELGLSS